MRLNRIWNRWLPRWFAARTPVRAARKYRSPVLQLGILEDRTLPATSAFYSMPTNLVGDQGTVVTVPVSISHLFDAAGNQGLFGADVVLTYDPTVFTVSDSD